MNRRHVLVGGFLMFWLAWAVVVQAAFWGHLGYGVRDFMRPTGQLIYDRLLRDAVAFAPFLVVGVVRLLRGRLWNPDRGMKT